MLGDVLFPPADYRRTTLSTIAWWESRRGAFNLIVGITGLITLVALKVITNIPPAFPTPLGWQPVVAYGLLANVCYTFGWTIEVALRQIIGKRAPAIGPALFRQGIAFSVGLTLLPILFASIGWVWRLGAWLFVRGAL
jgi:hypothetical protein